MRAKLIQDGDHQTIVLPPSIRLEGDEVVVEPTSSHGGLTISPVQTETEVDWQRAFRVFDDADFPDDFFGDRTDLVPEIRDL